MISIIICSRDNYMLQAVSQDIANTIGAAYEVVVIDNSQNKYNIFQAYNEGVKQSIGETICFMHEDVMFKTIDWGIVVENIFKENDDLGLIGVAGSSYKTRVPTHWSFPDAINKTFYTNIIQHYENNKIIHYLNNPKKQKLSTVVAVDGVWFCAKRQVFEKIVFDEKIFSNFHGYDVDFSLSVNEYYKVAVTFDVLIEHLSPGNFNRIWLSETLKLHEKWHDKLPINLERLTEQEQYLEEKKALIWLANKMLETNSFDSLVLKLIWSKDIIHKFGYAKFIGFNLSFGKFIVEKFFDYILKNKFTFLKLNLKIT